MNKRYHVNPETGVPNVCKAQTPEACKYYDKDTNTAPPHFDSKAEASRYYESITDLKTESLVKPKLSLIMDVDLLNNMIKDGYISRSFHKDDDTFQVLSYGPKTQYEGKWNEVTKQARGLIIQTSSDDYSDAIILQRPWRKFFTLQQLNNNWHLGDEENSHSSDSILQDIDFNAPAEVTDKMDGSLGISYIDPKGEIALSTKGSFHSDQAESFTKFLRNNEDYYNATEKMMLNNPNTTFLYELVGPDNRIVLSYDKTDISLLGAVNKSSGIYYSPSDYREWKESGLRHTEIMSHKTLNEALQQKPRENKEGLVVRFISNDPEKQYQVKIKQDDYLKLHRIATHLSISKVRSNIKESNLNFKDILEVAKSKDISKFEKINEELSMLRDNKLDYHADRREKIYKDSIIPVAEKALRIYNEIQELDDEVFKSENPVKDFVMNYSGKESDRVLSIILFKNRLNGEGLEDINVNGLLKSITSSIKG